VEDAYETLESIIDNALTSNSKSIDRRATFDAIPTRLVVGISPGLRLNSKG
jgi:hypothetical protein